MIHHVDIASQAPGACVAERFAGEGLRTVELTLDEVKTRFEPHTVSATLQCAGNRRHELKEVKPIEVSATGSAGLLTQRRISTPVCLPDAVTKKGYGRSPNCHRELDLSALQMF